jgi:hypothetical protein
MERPQHPELFDQAMKDVARAYFGEGDFLEGEVLDTALVQANAAHEAWITGEPLVTPEDPTPAEQLAYFRAAQLRQHFDAEPLMFGQAASG